MRFQHYQTLINATFATAVKYFKLTDVTQAEVDALRTTMLGLEATLGAFQHAISAAFYRVITDAELPEDTTVRYSAIPNLTANAFTILHTKRSGMHDLNFAPFPPPFNVQVTVDAEIPSVNLTWQPGGLADGYYVERSLDNGVTWTVAASVAATTTYTDSAVAIGNTYQYRIQAFRDTLASPYSVPVTATVGTQGQTPDIIQDVVATTFSATEVNVSWSAVANATGVRIERSIDAGVNWIAVATVNPILTTYRVGGLTPATAYDFRAFAINDAGEANPSNIASATTSALAAPGVPTGTAVSAISPTEAQVVWTPADNTHAGFQVDQSADAGSTWPVTTDVAANVLSLVRGGLTPGSPYSFRVRAENAAGNSAFSGTVSLTMPAAQTSPPAPPEDFRATIISSNNIRFDWTDVGTGIEARVLEYSLNGTDWSVGRTHSKTVYPDPTFTYTLANPSTLYHWRIKATNSAGDSAYTLLSPPTFTTPAPPGGVPVAPLNAREVSPTWFEAGDTLQNAIAIEWEQPNLDHSEVRVYRATNNLIFSLHATLEAGSTRYVDRGLQKSTYWYYLIRNFNANGMSVIPPAPGYSCRGYVDPDPPAAVTSPTAVAISNREVRVGWAHATVGEEYVRVERSSDAGVNWSSVGFRQQNAITFVDRSAVAGATYNYRVIAGNSGGDAAPAVVAGSVTVPATMPASAVPTTLAATAIGPRQVDLTWVLPGERIEDTIEIERSIDAGSTWKNVGNVFRGVRGHSDFGAPGATALDYRVRTRNVTGASAYSSIAEVTTPALSLTGSVPAAPTLNSVLPADSTRLSVEWTFTTATPDGSFVEVSSDGGSTWPTVIAVPKWWHQIYITGLTALTSYKVRVKCFNDKGDSAYSSTVTASTLAGGVVASPTGANPRLFWTPQRQAMWARRKTDFEASGTTTWAGAIHSKLKLAADRTVAGTPDYGDKGEKAALMYQITGLQSYCTAAYNQLAKYIPPQVNYEDPLIAYIVGANLGDFTREHYGDIVQTVSYILPGLNAEQKAIVFAAVLELSEIVLAYNIVGSRGGVRSGMLMMGDSDITTAYFFGLCMSAFLKPDELPQPGSLLMDTMAGYNVVSNPMGGIRPTALDRTSFVNEAAGNYAAMAEGGEWFESSEYNKGTPSLAIFGMEAARTARSHDGDNSEPWTLMREAMRQAGVQHIAIQVPDNRMAWQWGDDESAREPGGNGYATGWASTAGMQSGIARGNPEVGPFCLAQANDYWYGGILGGNTPNVRAYQALDPYGTMIPKSSLPKQRYAPGQGLALHHDGWADDDAFFGAMMKTPNYVDHYVLWFTNFQLWRKGEWAITSNIGYSLLCIEGECQNQMLLAGLSHAAAAPVGMGGAGQTGPKWDGAFKGPVAYEAGANGKYTYLCGENYGRFYATSEWQRPPEFQHEWTRSYVYFPSASKYTDSVVIFDRVLATNPKFLPTYVGSGAIGIAKYNVGVSGTTGISDQQRITNLPDNATDDGTPALKQWILHIWENPTLTANKATWFTPAGKPCQLDMLLPATRDVIVYDESILYDSPSYPIPPGYTTRNVPSLEERHWQLRTMPTTRWSSDNVPVWDTFLNVVHAGDWGEGAIAPPTATLISSSAGETARGALLTRMAANNALAVFCAVPSTRVAGVTTFNSLFQSGYTISVTTTAACDVVLCDLDPSLDWTTKVGAGAVIPQVVSEAGLVTLTIATAGTYTIVVAGS